MVAFWWLWVAAGGGAVLGMFLFAVMTMASRDPHEDVVVAQSTRDALT